MKHLLVLLLSVFIFVAGVTLFAKPASAIQTASEGTIELQNVSGQGTARCFAVSINVNGNYQILMSCRDLIYPLESSDAAYVVWADPVPSPQNRQNTPMRLGDLGYGRVMLHIGVDFTDLFVTTEVNTYGKTPQGSVIMKGRVEPISFLQTYTPPTPTPTPTISGPAQNFGQLIQGVPSPSPTPAAGGILSGIVKAVIIFVIIVFILIVIAGVIIFTRSRKTGF